MLIHSQCSTPTLALALSLQWREKIQHHTACDWRLCVHVHVLLLYLAHLASDTVQFLCLRYLLCDIRCYRATTSISPT